MAGYIKRIRTDQGEMQIDYNALANLPTIDATLKKSGQPADAKAVGDALSALSDSVDDVVQSMTATQLGLGNVDNTSDADKPVSTAQAAAIKAVQDDVDGHIANRNNPHGTTLQQLGLTATAAELNYMDGVTSAVQTQLNSKFDTSKVVNNLATTNSGFALDARQGKALNDMIVSGQCNITTGGTVTGSESNFQQYDCGGDTLNDLTDHFRSLTINFMKITGTKLAYMYGTFSFANPGQTVIKVWNSTKDIFPEGFKPAQAVEWEARQYHNAAHLSYNSSDGGATFIIVPAGHYYSFPSLHISAGGNIGNRTVKFFIPYFTT